MLAVPPHLPLDVSAPGLVGIVDVAGPGRCHQLAAGYVEKKIPTNMAKSGRGGYAWQPTLRDLRVLSFTASFVLCELECGVRSFAAKCTTIPLLLSTVIVAPCQHLSRDARVSRILVCALLLYSVKKNIQRTRGAAQPAHDQSRAAREDSSSWTRLMRTATCSAVRARACRSSASSLSQSFACCCNLAASALSRAHSCCSASLQQRLKAVTAL
jgi:hypothetical protein